MAESPILCTDRKIPHENYEDEILRDFYAFFFSFLEYSYLFTSAFRRGLVLDTAPSSAAAHAEADSVSGSLVIGGTRFAP